MVLLGYLARRLGIYVIRNIVTRIRALRTLSFAHVVSCRLLSDAVSLDSQVTVRPLIPFFTRSGCPMHPSAQMRVPTIGIKIEITCCLGFEKKTRSKRIFWNYFIATTSAFTAMHITYQTL